MNKLKILALLCPALILSFAAQAQQIPDLNVDGRQVQFHVFGSEGFAYSNDNNYLTMKTSDGSPFTDFGVNASTQITDKFRVGAQMYGYNVGHLGNWQPQLDWAFADYQFKDWFGVRAGKVKTPKGLYNETQDVEFLHTWALLPQSIYPLDLRGDSIAHLGVDLYGNVALKKAGTISYTVYGGKRTDDPEAGYLYGVNAITHGSDWKYYSETAGGADLRWTTPVPGLTAGSSFYVESFGIDGAIALGPMIIPAKADTEKDHALTNYVQYTFRNLRFDGEYDRRLQGVGVFAGGHPLSSGSPDDIRTGYVAVAYRVNKRLEIGSYHSRYYGDWNQPHTPNTNHIFDQVLTARIDLMNNLDFKVEGHFIDGFGGDHSFRGFYAIDNPQGLQPKTDLLVLRLGFHL